MQNLSMGKSKIISPFTLYTSIKLPWSNVRCDRPEFTQQEVYSNIVLNLVVKAQIRVAELNERVVSFQISDSSDSKSLEVILETNFIIRQCKEPKFCKGCPIYPDGWDPLWKQGWNEAWYVVRDLVERPRIDDNG